MARARHGEGARCAGPDYYRAPRHRRCIPVPLSEGPHAADYEERAAKWLLVAERIAELPKLRGGVWHPYRRKWATARKGLPLADVAQAGGWKSQETLARCYQQPDDATMLTVVLGGVELREKKA
jgi:hypothetical protein